MVGYHKYQQIRRCVAYEFPLFSHALATHCANRITNEIRKAKLDECDVRVNQTPFEGAPGKHDFDFNAGGVRVYVRLTTD